jgi:hypothetical protein
MAEIAGVPIAKVFGVTPDEILVQLEDGRRTAIPAGSPVYAEIAQQLNTLPAPQPEAQQVNAERDRRIGRFTFDGVAYQCDPDSQQQIMAMGTDARFAQLVGKGKPMDLRWASPNTDFGWIAADNSIIPMDAPHMSDFAEAAKSWVMRHIFAARALKDVQPIPADYDDDKYWPQA